MSSIFDVLDEREPRGGQEGFFDLAKNLDANIQTSKPSFLNESSKTINKFTQYSPTLGKALDYGKSVVKGGVEGLLKFGEAFGPIEGSGPTFEENIEILNELLPTEDDIGQRALRRGISEAPIALSTMGAGGLPRSLLAGFAGEGAKDLGAPEWAQTAAELTAFIGPDITKKLLQSGENKELIKFAKERGLSDEQITPLIQSEFKQKWLSKLSPRRGKIEESLSESKKGIDTIYNYFREAGSKAVIPEQSAATMLNEMSALLKQMPAEVRVKIEKDAMDLISSKPTANALFNFWADINYASGLNAKQLSLLKGPIRKALKATDPKLAQEFEFGNKLAENYYKISGKLKPTLLSDLVGAGESLAILGSIATGYYPFLTKFVGEKSARMLARELLINPRLQQLGEKTLIAMNEGKATAAYKILKGYIKELSKVDPITAAKLNKLSEEEIDDFLRFSSEKIEENN